MKNQNHAEFCEEIDAIEFERHVIAFNLGETPVTMRQARLFWIEFTSNLANKYTSWTVAVDKDHVELICKCAMFFDADAVEVAGIQYVTGKVVLNGHGYQG